MPGQLAQRVNDPTNEEWERYKDVIHEVYVVKDWPGRAVVEYMKTSYNFHTSLRMLKDRFKKWGFDRKTIRHAVYRGMAAIYDHRKTFEGKKTVFRLTVREKRKDVDLRQINKHYKRIDPNKPLAYDKERCEEVVRRYGLEFYTPPCSPPLSPVHGDNVTAISATDVAHHSIQPTRLGTNMSSSMQAENASRGHDLIEIFGQLHVAEAADDSVDHSVAAYSGSCGAHRVPRPLQSHEALAGRWTWHSFRSCVYSIRGEMDLAAFHRQNAKTCLNGMLNTGNEQTLPGLLWISTMMIAHGHDDLLRQFFEDCCDVNDQRPQPNHHFGAIFDFCLAVLDSNEQAIDHTGSIFIRDKAPFTIIYNEDSPNTLVRNYYHAWHLLRQKHYDKVVEMVHDILRQSERVMGRVHPVTVNCLATLSRAHAEQDHDVEATAILTDALHRSQESWGYQNPFRLQLMRRLAMLQKKAGRLDLAEETLRAVVEGRRQLLGLSNGYTWGAIEDLTQLLNDVGKRDEAAALRAEMDRLFLYTADSFVPPRQAYLPQSGAYRDWEDTL